MLTLKELLPLLQLEISHVFGGVPAASSEELVDKSELPFTYNYTTTWGNNFALTIAKFQNPNIPAKYIQPIELHTEHYPEWRIFNAAMIGSHNKTCKAFDCPDGSVKLQFEVKLRDAGICFITMHSKALATASKEKAIQVELKESLYTGKAHGRKFGEALLRHMGEAHANDTDVGVYLLGAGEPVVTSSWVVGLQIGLKFKKVFPGEGLHERSYSEITRAQKRIEKNEL